MDCVSESDSCTLSLIKLIKCCFSELEASLSCSMPYRFIESVHESIKCVHATRYSTETAEDRYGSNKADTLGRPITWSHKGAHSFNPVLVRRSAFLCPPCHHGMQAIPTRLGISSQQIGNRSHDAGTALQVSFIQVVAKRVVLGPCIPSLHQYFVG